LASGEVVPVAYNAFLFGSKTLAATDGSGGKFGEPLNLRVNNACVLVTADGRLLARTHGPGCAERCLKDGLKKWWELPETERRPGAMKVQPMKERPLLAPTSPPPGGLVLKVYTRNLKRDAKGELARITAEDLKDNTRYPGWDIAYTEPTRDNLWLTAEEWRSLVPAQPRQGDRFPVPTGIRDRIFLFHLQDMTQGGLEYPWFRQHLKAGELTLTVEETTPRTRLRINGSVRFVSNTMPECGFEARVVGALDYDPSKKAVQQFRFIVLGETWGGGSGIHEFTRPGRAPLAMSFELVSGNNPIDRIAPLGYVGNSGTVGYPTDGVVLRTTIRLD